MQSRKSLIELALLLGRETKASVKDALQMLRMSKRWKTLMMSACNRPLTDKEYAVIARLKEELASIAERIEATGFILSEDPRGCTVKLTVKSGVCNDFGNEGICIL